MADTVQWEYRVLTIGHWWGTRDEAIEAQLNALGEEGWEVIHAQTPYGSGKVTVVAKRPLAATERRRRSQPQ